MIREELITECINDMINHNHIMEYGEIIHPDGLYSFKFKKLKKKLPRNKKVESN